MGDYHPGYAGSICNYIWLVKKIKNIGTFHLLLLWIHRFTFTVHGKTQQTMLLA